MNITPIILCGGNGSRLWPISRKSFPKQFNKIFNNKSLFQDAILRFKNLKKFNKPIIICNEEHRFLVETQLSEIKIKSEIIILEPSPKNTLSAIALGCNYLVNNNIQGLAFITPSDHKILSDDDFHDLIQDTIKFANDHIVIFGITIKYPETGFGYIKKAKNVVNNIYKIKKFIEKPKLILAKKIAKNENYLWNSGMFLTSPSFFLNKLKIHHNKNFKLINLAIKNPKKDLNFLRIDEKYFEKCDDISVDYAILENLKEILVKKLDINWSDVGSWIAMDKLQNKDKNNNSLLGNVFALDTTNCYINSSKQLIATIGVKDLIVVSTNDAVLIANKNNAQDIKTLFNNLLKYNPDYCNYHNKVDRPWGGFEVLDVGKNFKIKKIFVKPNCSLSLQKHNHRAEHWVVVKGIANVSREKENLILKENQSMYIEIGNKHRLENRQNFELELIEIQTGNYLQEDDIVRFDDKYGRLLKK
jgi:mannose-1-phosphate guanylyltransferase/mannose-6-phosphate isomerase